MTSIQAVLLLIASILIKSIPHDSLVAYLNLSGQLNMRSEWAVLCRTREMTGSFAWGDILWLHTWKQNYSQAVKLPSACGFQVICLSCICIVNDDGIAQSLDYLHYLRTVFRLSTYEELATSLPTVSWIASIQNLTCWKIAAGCLMHMQDLLVSKVESGVKFLLGRSLLAKP